MDGERASVDKDRLAVAAEQRAEAACFLRQPVGGWKTYGGIFRDMYLLATPKLYVEETELSAQISTDAKSDVKTAKVQVRSKIVDEVRAEILARIEAVTEVLTVKFAALLERAEPGATMGDLLPEMRRLLDEALAEVG